MPVKETYVRARVDADLKADSEDVLRQLGMSTTEAIRLFLAQIRLRRGLPFPIELPGANDDLLMPTASRQAALDAVYDD
jgi:DNA-damage-inducible protein J